MAPYNLVCKEVTSPDFGKLKSYNLLATTESFPMVPCQFRPGLPDFSTPLLFSFALQRLRWKKAGNSYQVDRDMFPSHCSCPIRQSMKRKKRDSHLTEG